VAIGANGDESTKNMLSSGRGGGACHERHFAQEKVWSHWTLWERHGNGGRFQIFDDDQKGREARSCQTRPSPIQKKPKKGPKQLTAKRFSKIPQNASRGQAKGARKRLVIELKKRGLETGRSTERKHMEEESREGAGISHLSDTHNGVECGR